MLRQMLPSPSAYRFDGASASAAPPVWSGAFWPISIHPEKSIGNGTIIWLVRSFGGMVFGSGNTRATLALSTIISIALMRVSLAGLSIGTLPHEYVLWRSVGGTLQLSSELAWAAGRQSRLAASVASRFRFSVGFLGIFLVLVWGREGRVSQRAFRLGAYRTSRAASVAGSARWKSTHCRRNATLNPECMN
ncbi:hypothetical protein BamMEX5DRAFT_6712 [Burkholderia ambifaria MEX-5]|uniref:Uncharacterized protein n=1 Tax=Burkholderia ambifaria MEX-5 TaxID=396597 RepID=B1TFZ6_9BURK|nr:hypothetical protein BamMEX5DRAFT_6712 [Burkholderia ambifaria MEX-5]